MDAFPDLSPEAALQRAQEQLAARTAADQARIKQLEDENKAIKAEAILRDQAFRERQAAGLKPSSTAIESLERAYTSKLPGERNAKEEHDEKQAANLFGPGSDGAAANRLALTNLTEYRRLKSIARTKLNRIG